MKKQFIFIFAILVSIYLSVLNAEIFKADIHGYVRDAESMEALPFANVMVPGTNRGTTTNADGYFVLVNMPIDTVQVEVRYIGYNPVTMNVVNKIGGAVSVQVLLKSAIIEIGGVTIIANSELLETNKALSQISLSPQQLSSLPSMGEVDVFKSLQLLPGVSAVGDGGSGLYVRGGTPDQNLIIFDGMTIYHVDHFFGFFSAFNADAIKDIQMIKGGFDAQYGGRLSSVVNLTGKTGDHKKRQVNVGLNLLSFRGEFETPLSDWGSFLIAGRRSYTDFIQSPLYNNIYELVTGDDAGAGAVGNSGRGGRMGGQMNMEIKPSFYFYDLNSKLTINPSERDIITASFYSGKDNLDKSQDFGGMQFRFNDSQDSGTLSTSDYSNWGTVGVSAEWARQWSSRVNMTFLTAYSNYFSDYARSSSAEAMLVPPEGMNPDSSLSVRRNFAGATDESNAVQDVNAKLDMSWQCSENNGLSFGIHHNQFANEFASAYDDTTSLLDLDNTAVLSAFYIQEKWNKNRLTLKGGLRSSYYSGTQKIYWEPRASAAYMLTDKLQARAAWGHYYQFVNQITTEDVTQGVRDFWILANNEMRPGFSQHYIAGLSYENKDYVFSIEGFKKDLDNVIEFSRRFIGRMGTQYENFFIGSGHAEGVELLLQKKYGNFTGWAGYTFSRVKHQYDVFNDGAAFFANHDRTHEVNLVGKYSLGLWNFSATWVYTTGNPYTAPSSQYFVPLLDGETNSYIHISDKNAMRIPAYHRLDMSVSRKLESEKFRMNAGLSIFNAYNHDNVWYRDYNLDTTPLTVTDVLMLGITPTIFFEASLK